MRLGVRAAVIDGRLVAGDVDVEDGIVARRGPRPARRGRPRGPGLRRRAHQRLRGRRLPRGRRATDIAARARRSPRPAWSPTSRRSSPRRRPTPRAALGASSPRPATAGGPRVLGAHLEGPFLSRAWPGAHDPPHLRAPDLELGRALCDAGPVDRDGTLAPELPGALELVDWLVARGVVVSCGHSDADAARRAAAFDAGARAVTHVHNAHRRWAPRDPGLGAAPRSCVPT